MAYLRLTAARSKGYGQGHVHCQYIADNMGQTMQPPTNSKSHTAFRLPDLNLTFAYSKGQFDSWNGALYDDVLRTNGST